MGVVSLAAGVLSFSWAPETARKSLAETAHRSTPNYSRKAAAVPA